MGFLLFVIIQSGIFRIHSKFFINVDCHHRVIVVFVETKRKDDLSCLRTTPEEIKAVSRILHGDGREHKPCWYTNDPDDAALLEDDQDYDDDDPLPSSRFRTQSGTYGTPSDARVIHSVRDVRRSMHRKESSTRRDAAPHPKGASAKGEGRRCSSSGKRVDAGWRRIKILSAGRSRNTRCSEK